MASLPALPPPALAQTADRLAVAPTPTVKGHRISKLTGRDVVNDRKVRIGRIDDFIVADDNDAIFAVLQIGDILGTEAHLVAVPFRSLVLDDPSGWIVLPGATPEALNQLPVFKYGG
jgi:sporulation protein YlmC with PRC-barrel domain